MKIHKLTLLCGTLIGFVIGQTLGSIMILMILEDPPKDQDPQPKTQNEKLKEKILKSYIRN